MRERLARSMNLEDQGFSAAGAHHRKDTFALAQSVKRIALRGMRICGSNKRMDERTRQLIIGKTGEHGATRSIGSIAKGFLGGGRGGHNGGVAVHIVFRARGVMAKNVFNHEFGLHAALPALRHGFEHEVDNCVACHALIDIGHAKHNGGNARNAVGGDETHVIARFSHRSTIGHGHAGSCKQRNPVALSKRFERRNLLDSVDIELVELNNSSDLVGVLEVLGGELG